MNSGGLISAYGPAMGHNPWTKLAHGAHGAARAWALALAVTAHHQLPAARLVRAGWGRGLRGKLRRGGFY
jgi:hypothetical protein